MDKKKKKPPPMDCPECRRLAADPHAKSTYAQFRQHNARHAEWEGRPIVTGSSFKDDLTCIQSDDFYRRALSDLERLIDNDFLKQMGITGS
jgi:hypothetical protein